MTWTEVVYVVAGIALPAYYVPQALKCVADNTQLAAYSMSKAATQLALRAAMLPFVFGIGNMTMTGVVALDFVGRAGEFAAAVWSLVRQGLSSRQILQRCVPAAGRVSAIPLPQQVTVHAQVATPLDPQIAELSLPQAGLAPLYITPSQEETPHGQNIIALSSVQQPDRRRSRRGVDRVRRRGR